MNRSLILFLLVFLIASPSFALKKDKEDRAVKVNQYLSEFSSPVLKENYFNIYLALKNVLLFLPQEAFDKITAREYPAVFLEVPHYGSSPWADSIGIIQDPKDKVAFTKGVWIVQLNINLNKVKDIEAIEGVIFHELAHKYLGHLGGVFSIEVEKQANHQIKKWGFDRQFQKAKLNFGTHATKARMNKS